MRCLRRKNVILETLREREFSPIKNSEGEDSPATCCQDQIEKAASWLEAAGVKIPRKSNGDVDATIEISPLFAENQEQLKEKVDSEMVIDAGDQIYLGE